MSNEQIINFEGCVLTFLLCSGFHCSCALPRSWRAIIISDNTWWLFGKRCVWMFACLQCTVCILNASSPCAPRVKKIRPIVGLLVVSVDTLRLEEASINIDPPHFERCVYFNIWERVWNCKGCTFPYSRCDINGWWFDLSYLVLSRIVQLVVELVLLSEVGRRLNESWRDQKNSPFFASDDFYRLWYMRILNFFSTSNYLWRLVGRLAWRKSW